MVSSKYKEKTERPCPIIQSPSLISSDYTFNPAFYPDYLREKDVRMGEILNMEYYRKWWDAERYYDQIFRNTDARKKRPILLRQRIPNVSKKNRPWPQPNPREKNTICRMGIQSVSSMTSLLSAISEGGFMRPLPIRFCSCSVNGEGNCDEICGGKCPLYCTNRRLPVRHSCCTNENSQSTPRKLKPSRKCWW